MSEEILRILEILLKIVARIALIIIVSCSFRLQLIFVREKSRCSSFRIADRWRRKRAFSLDDFFDVSGFSFQSFFGTHYTWRFWPMPSFCLCCRRCGWTRIRNRTPGSSGTWGGRRRPLCSSCGFATQRLRRFAILSCLWLKGREVSLAHHLSWEKHEDRAAHDQRGW